MATLVNKMNREVKVIIPNMREFSTFYSDTEGVIPMFFKSNWVKVKEEEHWKPTEDEMEALEIILRYGDKESTHIKNLTSLYEQLKKLIV